MNPRSDDEKSIPLNDIDVHDLGANFSGHLTANDKFLGHIGIDSLKNLLKNLKLQEKIESCGFSETRLTIEIASDQDHRIYYHSKKGDVLFFLRVKMGSYQLNQNTSVRQLIAIDWFQTQNINSKKKNLFPGQKYPGLGTPIIFVFKELVLKLVELTESDGIITVPEFFHDAVMFVKLLKLRFVNPVKAADYEHLLEHGSVKDISKAIEEERIVNAKSGEVYHWQHGEMIKFLKDDHAPAIFDENYNDLYREHLNEVSYRILAKKA